MFLEKCQILMECLELLDARRFVFFLQKEFLKDTTSTISISMARENQKKIAPTPTLTTIHLLGFSSLY